MENIKNFTNIDEEDFEGMYGGQPIVLRRGQTKAFTERIAKHLAGQLVHKILTRQKKDYLLDPDRQSLMNSMLGDVIAPEPEPLPEEVPKEEKIEESSEEEFPEVKAEEEKIDSEDTPEQPKKKRRSRKKK